MFKLNGLLALLALFVFCGTALARPDKNSFLNHRVWTVGDLLHQVKTDWQVRDRFERHFAMNQEQLFAYLGSLHRTKTKYPGHYVVYSIPPDGHVKAHTEHLRRGTAIFADRSGNPVLLVKCGNPMTRGPNTPVATKFFKPELAGDLDMHPIGPGEVVPDLAALDVTPADVAMPEVAVVPPAPPYQPVTGEATQPVLSGAPNLGPLLALLPLVGVKGPHSGGPPKLPTPEPSTFGVFAVAGTALFVRQRSRNRT